MFLRLTTIAIVLMAFNASASIQSITKKELMERHVSELEAKINGNSIDVFNADEVLLADNNYKSYLVLCSAGIATKKCDEARQDHPKLIEALNVHFEFHKDLAKMNMAVRSLEINKEAADD